jgi:hypothetical protein
MFETLGGILLGSRSFFGMASVKRIIPALSELGYLPNA